MRRMRQYAFALPEAFLHEAQELAQAEQTSLDDFVRAAIADKIAAARIAQYFRTRAARAEPQAFLAVLERMHITPCGRARALTRRTPWSRRCILDTQSWASRPDIPRGIWPHRQLHQ